MAAYRITCGAPHGTGQKKSRQPRKLSVTNLRCLHISSEGLIEACINTDVTIADGNLPFLQFPMECHALYAGSISSRRAGIVAILSTSRQPKITHAIIGSAAVGMANFKNRPLSSLVKPDNSVRRTQSVAQPDPFVSGNLPNAFGNLAGSTLSGCPLPGQNACQRIIVEEPPDILEGAWWVNSGSGHYRPNSWQPLGLVAMAVVASLMLTRCLGKDRIAAGNSDPAKSIRRTTMGDAVLHAPLRASDGDGVGAPDRE